MALRILLGLEAFHYLFWQQRIIAISPSLLNSINIDLIIVELNDFIHTSIYYAAGVLGNMLVLYTYVFA
jgi:hypothetical protein